MEKTLRLHGNIYRVRTDDSGTITHVLVFGVDFKGDMPEGYYPDMISKAMVSCVYYDEWIVSELQKLV